MEIKEKKKTILKIIFAFYERNQTLHNVGFRWQYLMFWHLNVNFKGINVLEDEN